jgi:hypothetical protein
MADLDAFARAHMAQQVREVAMMQSLLARLWDDTMDPADLDGSFELFQSKANVIIKAARSKGELTAQQYYELSKTAAGYSEAAPFVAEQPPGSIANRKALHATSVAKAKAGIARGEDPNAALEKAKAAMLSAAKRRILEAPRRRLIALSTADDDARGWARVSDGRPCYFCAMLVSRGPVYTGLTGTFRAHDGCGCSAKPVFDNDPEGGWSPDARALRKLWDGTDPENGQHGSYDWRGTYNRAISTPGSELLQATASTLQLAA